MVDDEDGRTPDHGHPISSPCEPYGSGELKMVPRCGGSRPTHVVDSLSPNRHQ